MMKTWPPAGIDWYYADDYACIAHGDCREILPLLPKVDAVVTDPPFGINWSRATWADSREDYDALMAWLVESCRVVVPEGWCFVFQAMPNCGRFHQWFPEGWRIFAACKNFAQIRPTGVWHSWDPVVFWRNGPNSGPNSGHVNRDYFVGNVAGVFAEKNKHPCPKPLDTMRHIVALAASQGGVILDPFMGSGTTLVAAKRLGRKAIGIEISEEYCRIAVDRLKQDPLPFEPVRTESPDEGRRMIAQRAIFEDEP